MVDYFLSEGHKQVPVRVHHLSQMKQHDNMTKKKNLGGCYHCGSVSHRAKSCPTVSCRICGEKGHDTGGCPQRPLPPVDLGHFKGNNIIGSSNSHTEGVARNKLGRDSFTYIELFAGMGGFRVALDRLGGICVFASETDRFCVKNYLQNFGDRPAGDITRISSARIPNHDLLVGGFPCQPFSSSGNRLGLEDPTGKGVLFRHVVRVLKEKQPKGFLLENVRGLYLHDGGNTLSLVVEELENAGYNVKYELLDAVRLLPQERCRLYFVGVRSDLKHDEFIFPDFPDLGRGVEDILHKSGELSNLELEKLKLNENQLAKVKAQKYTIEHPEARFMSDTAVAAKTIQSSYTRYMVGSQFVPMNIEECGSWRRFSLREVARLQGFPENGFTLCKERGYHMVGNAVCPPVIAMIAAKLLINIDDWRELVNRSDEGWTVAQSLLLDASPEDSRKVGLEKKLKSLKSHEEDMI